MSDASAGGGVVSRLLGLLMMLAGSVVIWGALELRASGAALVVTGLGPFALCVGLWAVIEGPALPAEEASPLLNGLAACGLVLGAIFVFWLAFA